MSRLIAGGSKPVLAVDADPNSCLDSALGVEVTRTVGAVREEARELAGKGLGSGVSKQQMLELKISESLVEADDFDLIAMGRCEGPGKDPGEEPGKMRPEGSIISGVRLERSSRGASPHCSRLADWSFDSTRAAPAPESFSSSLTGIES